MNKRNIFMLLAAISLCMSGCSAENEEKTPQITTAAVNNYEAKESDAKITGEVTEITGNRVTLALGSLNENHGNDTDRQPPDFSNGERPDFANGEMPDFANGEMPDFSNGEKPDFANGEKPDFSNGEKPDFANGKRPDFSSGEMPDMKGGSRRGNASIEKSGEEATYTIPVGMTIDGLSGRSTDYSGITVGTILTLTVNEDGVVCAASVE